MDCNKRTQKLSNLLNFLPTTVRDHKIVTFQSPKTKIFDKTFIKAQDLGRIHYIGHFDQNFLFLLATGF